MLPAKVRLFSRVFGMAGGAPAEDVAAQFGGVDATEAAAKLVRNRAAVAADIVQHARQAQKWRARRLDAEGRSLPWLARQCLLKVADFAAF